MAVRTTSAITQVDHIGTALLTFPTRTTGAIVSRTTSARVTTATALPADSTILPAPTRTVTPTTRTTSVLTSTTPTVLATAVRPITPTVRSASTLTQSVSDPTILATPSGVAAPPATRATSLLSQSQSANAFVAPVVTSAPPSGVVTVYQPVLVDITDYPCLGVSFGHSGNVGSTITGGRWQPGLLGGTQTGWVVAADDPDIAYEGFRLDLYNQSTDPNDGLYFYFTFATGDICGTFTKIDATMTQSSGAPPEEISMGDFRAYLPPGASITYTAAFTTPLSTPTDVKAYIYTDVMSDNTVHPIYPELWIDTDATVDGANHVAFFVGSPTPTTTTSVTTGYTLASPTFYATPKRVPSQSTAPTRFRRRWWWRW